MFHGAHQMKLDSKGRVSAPSDFRARLKDEGASSFVCFPSDRPRVFSVMSEPRFADMLKQLESEFVARHGGDTLALFYDGANNIAAKLAGEAVELPVDDNGRIIVRKDLRTRLGSADTPEASLWFLGQGRFFQLWADDLWESEGPYRQPSAMQALAARRAANSNAGGGGGR
jgi:MraZ protein